MKKVDFFIIGAPKCGTTSLAEYLREHPQVDFARRKEPNFFCKDFSGLHKLSNIKTLNDYLSLFTFENGKIRGEASTTYLFSDTAVNNILKHNSHAKFIAILRNPVQMALAWHTQKLLEKQENEPDFKKAWNKQKDRKRGFNIPPLCTDAKMLYYRDWCLLGYQVQRLFEQVPKGQRHIIFFDDLVENPASVYRRVLDFLELPYDGRTEFPAYNQYQECRSPKLDEYRVRLNRLRKTNPLLRKLHASMTVILPTQGLGIQKLLLSINYKKGKRKKLDEAFRKQLVSEFYDDICLLERLTGRDLGSWKR